MATGNEPSRHVPQKDYYDVSDTAALLQIGRNKVYELAKRADDPLPFRRLLDSRRGMFIARQELSAWVTRNTILIALQGDVRGNGHGGR